MNKSNSKPNTCLPLVVDCLFLYIYTFFLVRFVVRDFVWDDSAIAASKEQITKLAQDKKKQFVGLTIIIVVVFYFCFVFHLMYSTSTVYSIFLSLLCVTLDYRK